MCSSSLADQGLGSFSEEYAHPKSFASVTATFADTWNITTYSKSFHVPAQIPIHLPRPEVFLSASSDLVASPAQRLIPKKDTCMHASTHAEQGEFTEKIVSNTICNL